MYSIVVPVYRNEESIDELLCVLTDLDHRLGRQVQVVMVVDGSPDRSYAFLRERLPRCSFKSVLVQHSRNFGSFAAIRTGLHHATGEYVAVMAADLQEPPELIENLFARLREGADVAIGVREKRADPWLSRLSSRLFWGFYRRLVQTEVPSGGADVFACRTNVRERILELREANSTLVGLLFWLGYRRALVSYTRLARSTGASGWSLDRKLRYMTDSIFAFSDLPIRLMVFFGSVGTLIGVVLGTAVFIAKIKNLVPVPGYAATIITLGVFGSLNSLALGIIGSYVWRAFENTKGRPHALVMSTEDFAGSKSE